MRLPKAIIFDWDGTLADTQATIMGALNETLQKFGLNPLTKEEYHERTARSSKSSFPEMFGDKADEAQAFFYERIEKTHLATVRPFAEDIGPFLRWLQDADVPLFIVSNKRGDLLRAEVGALGWSDFFVKILGSKDAAQDKPHRAIVDLALEGTGISPEKDKIWFIGDGMGDVEAARNSGCVAVIVGADKRAGALADYSFQNYSEVRKFFERPERDN